MYHRVTDLECDPWSLAVSPHHFREHLDVLKKKVTVLPLQRLVSQIGSKQVTAQSVVITFDDGYADNFCNARPLLEEKNVPATMYSVSGFVGKQREFWWDELERIFLQPGTLPQELSLTVSDASLKWNLGNFSNYSEQDFELHQKWATWQPPPTSRQIIYYEVWKTLKSLNERARNEQMQNIRLWANLPPESRSTHRTMTQQELFSLKDHALIEVGCHTATHQRLSALSSEEQYAEIQESKLVLEEILQQPIKSFAYPYGWHGDYTQDTVELVKNSGFRSACSAFQEVVTERCDIFQLPRFPVQDWDGEAFEKQLDAWTAGNQSL